MPRVILNNLAYHEKDLRTYIRSEMREQKVSQASLAGKLGTTQQNFSMMLSKLSFKPGQMMVIFKELGTTDEQIAKLFRL